MLAIAHESGVTSQGTHFPQIFFHIVIFTEQLIAEQTVYGKHCRGPGEIISYRGNGIFDNGPVVAQLQKNKYIRVIHLSEAGQRVPVHFFDGNDTGIVSIDLTKGILKGLRENLLFRHAKNLLIYLFGGLTV